MSCHTSIEMSYLCRDESSSKKRRALSVPSINIIRNPLPTPPNTRSGSVQASLHDIHVGDNTESWKPLKLLVRITDVWLVIYAVIFIVAIGIVAMVVLLAIIKSYVLDCDVVSLWTDNWLCKSWKLCAHSTAIFDIKCTCLILLTKSCYRSINKWLIVKVVVEI